MSLVPIDEVVHFDVTTHHPSTGAVTDADSGPTYDVFEEATDTPILDDQTLTKRTSLTGNYRGSFTASAANGFEAGKWYNVIVSATVNSIAAKHRAMLFRVAPAESSAGVPKTDVSHNAGTAITSAAGIQEVKVASIAADAITASAIAANAIGSSEIADGAITAAKIADGAIDAATFAAGAIDAAAIADGAIDAGAIAADAITAAKIADNAIDAGAIASDAITSAKIADNAITANKIASNAITAAKIATDAIDDDALSADAVTAIQSGLATSSALSTVGTNVSTLLTRIPAALFSGITSLAEWLGLIAGKQTGNSTARTELRATGAGSGTYDETTDSQEATRDNMGTAQTGDAYARLGAPAGASVSADIAAVKTDTAAIKLKTDNLPSDPADASDIASSFSGVSSTLATIAGYLDTEIAAIKLKTDNLPSDPADQSAVEAAITAAVSALATAAALATVASNVTSIKSKTDNLPEGVKKNQALADFEFLMVDAVDHVTGKTGLTVTAERSIDGGAFAACANSPVEVSGGLYKIALAAADVNGTIVTFRFTASGADATVLTLKTAA